MVIALTCAKAKVLAKFSVITLVLGTTSVVNAVSVTINCLRIACPSVDGWEAALENTYQERACGDHKEYRFCETFGVWGAIDSSECCMLFFSSSHT